MCDSWKSSRSRSHPTEHCAESQKQKPPKAVFANWWRWRKLNPRPNLSMKALLRRIVSVIFKVGCEERRRNHSYPIPYLDVLVGSPDIDPTDNSAYPSRCRNRGRETSRGERPLGDRVRERKVLRTEVRRLYACKSVLCKYGSR